MSENGNEALHALLRDANVDESLKHRLLTRPEEVAEERGVKLSASDIDRLKKVGAFRTLAAELRHGAVVPDDGATQRAASVWLSAEVRQVISHFWPPNFYRIFYPASGIDRQQVAAELLSRIPRGYPYRNFVGSYRGVSYRGISYRGISYRGIREIAQVIAEKVEQQIVAGLGAARRTSSE